MTADAGTDKITYIAHGLGNADRVKVSCATGGSIPGGLSAGVWYYVVNAAADDFQLALTDGGAAIDIASAGSQVQIDSTAPYGEDLVDGLADADITASSEHAGWVNVPCDFSLPGGETYGGRTDNADHLLFRDDPIQFTGGGVPAPFSAFVTYYFIPITAYLFRLALTPGGPAVPTTSAASGVPMSTLEDFTAKHVRDSTAGNWRLGSAADWGTLSNGYWQIPDAQAGLANAELKPWIQFDFGSSKTPRVWRLRMPAGQPRENLLRLVAFFSSADAATWSHEHYFELPPVAGQWHDVLIPKASTNRYWRICIRSKWVELGTRFGFDSVRAFEHARHWWRGGVIRWDADTATAALRGMTRKVLGSYNGAVDVVALPAVPASGDTFIIERGCPRTFNACCERRNWENFGGFLDLPNQSIIR